MTEGTDTNVVASGLVDFLPEGWYRGGSHPGQYIMGIDETVSLTGTASAFIKSKYEEQCKLQGSKWFGTVFQNFYPKDYLSRRVRVSAFLRFNLDDGNSWSGIWMRTEFIGDANKSCFFLDNMSNRKLIGSSNNQWVPCSIVMDVPQSCINIKFGFLLFGSGIVWADNFDLEVVDNSVPLTGVPPNTQMLVN